MNAVLPATRTARAVVARELNAPVVVETISVEAPQRGEVTIRLAACGVCHSDLSATNGTIAFPLPLVLALAVLIFVCAFGGHEFRAKEVAILTVILIIFSVLVFVKGLTLPFPLWPDFMS